MQKRREAIEMEIGTWILDQVEVGLDRFSWTASNSSWILTLTF